MRVLRSASAPTVGAHGGRWDPLPIQLLVREASSAGGSPAGGRFFEGALNFIDGAELYF